MQLFKVLRKIKHRFSRHYRKYIEETRNKMIGGYFKTQIKVLKDDFIEVDSATFSNKVKETL